MDKKLLQALDNIGDALELLVDALNNKGEAQSSTGAALQGGDFGKQLESINAGIQSIKTDTQEILKNTKSLLVKISESKKGISIGIGKILTEQHKKAISNGFKSKFNNEQLKEIIEMYNSNISLRKIATIESIGSSTRIEGSKLSDKEVEKLLTNLETYSFANRDEEEVAS
jgi:hypothetical protein